MVIPFLSRTRPPGVAVPGGENPWSLVCAAAQRFTRTVRFWVFGFNTLLPWKRTVIASFFAEPTFFFVKLIVFLKEQDLLSLALRALSSVLPFLIVSWTVPVHAVFLLTPAGTLILPLT